MSGTDTNFKLSALALAVVSAMSFNAVAAEQNQDTTVVAAEDSSEAVEVIEVKGLRGGLLKSMNNKRFNSNVSDSINAEDVGKTTDQNIADALGRITGVSVVTNGGNEGSQVTVRGASSNQNQITLNGQVLTSTGDSQAVDLSLYSADILSKLEVVKTPSADHDEGSLGATINLTTVRPLDVQNERINVVAQGRYNDFAEEYDHKFQLSGVKKFFDESFGIAFTFYDETNSYRKDQFRVGRYEASPEISIARDTDGNLINNVRAIEPNNSHYEAHFNEDDRWGGTIGLQYAPSDTTNVMFDVTYSKKKNRREYDGISVNRSTSPNMIEGETTLANREPSLFTDPQEDWYVYNPDTYTLVKRLDRFTKGDISRSQGGTDDENYTASLRWNQELTDTLYMDAAISMSKSESDTVPLALYTNMQNYSQVSSELLFDKGQQGLITELVGYDCTTGKCRLQVGESFADLGENITAADTPDGELPWRDNEVNTAFNPADANTFHLGSISRNQSHIEDEIKTFKLDFDWDVDAYGVTQIEFGTKISQREKYVDHQQFTYNANTKTEAVEDENGDPLVPPSGPLTNILAPMILDESGMRYDNVMGSLGIPRSNATQNWTTIDLVEAYNLVVGDPELSETVNSTNTRETDIDTKAFYIKANFDYLDGALTGNVGMRMVKTDVDARGYSGATFYDFPQNGNESEFDWLTLRDLRNTSLPACSQPFFGDPGETTYYEQKFQRVDGLGWRTTQMVDNGLGQMVEVSNPDPSTWTRIADQGACHDPAYAEWADYHFGGNQGNYPAGYTPPTINWYTMWRYADVSTSRDHGWGDPAATTPHYGYTGNGTTDVGPEFYQLGEVDKTIASYPSKGSHSYTNYLPSLNLNYAFTDDFIGRFAASKTMTRPEIDELRAGLSLNEMWATYWGGGRERINPGTINMYNTKLDPLESKNLDVSLEWYFNDVSMLSVAFFYKDMSNFTDTESFRTYIKDVRDVDSIDPNDILLSHDPSLEDEGLSGCMPLRTTTDIAFNKNDPLVVSDAWSDVCHEFNVNRLFNGDSATVKGIEVGYQQMYDFLPGYFLSGLGLSANYTYQDSEYDKQISDVTGKSMPSYPVADTPEHAYNVTGFWEQDGHQIRLSFQGQDDSLVGKDWNTGLRGRTYQQGSLWREGRNSLDLSATWQANDWMSLSFQAINLTDSEHRTFWTSRELEVVPVLNEAGDGYSYAALLESTPMDGATKSRTITRYKVGTTYRLALRATF
ncbi:hypothetical protein GCM10011369_16460 [Neiella marina]|uniref:TonB-dependent receptor n=1 Tax=Neiella marina TaxID=508461 RepID=A0A8J2U4L9_9GAMM|nr:TonB-dependent receptor [Neiella marina]GGA75286.1 hypothetical protein GCM10011369_16460 [Neiella marina]